MNDYDPSKICKVKIGEIFPNDWNPKDDEKAYRKVVRSIGLNGLVTPIFVRTVDGRYEIVDGYHRWKAAKELGYSEVYAYDLGEISEEEAKALALWFQVQVPFDNIKLAPLVLELDQVGIELPFSEKEKNTLLGLEKFDMDSEWADEEPVPEDNTEKDTLKTFSVKMQPEDVARLREIVKRVCSMENVSEGRALELLLEAGLEIASES